MDQELNLIKQLAIQFANANGINYIDLKSKQFINELNEWLKLRNLDGKKYVKFLDELNLDFKNSDCVEVGKTKYDTVAKDFDTKIITPSYKIFEDVNPSKIIRGSFYVVDGMPIIIKNGRLMNINRLFSTYMTQNNYTKKEIASWPDLYNNGKNDIIIGAFGSTYDKDKLSKIEHLSSLKNKILTDCSEEYLEDDDTYCYVLSTSKEKKLKYKCKYR